MSDDDKLIPRLLDLKRQNQERRLAAIMGELRKAETERIAIETQTSDLDSRGDGFVRLSLQNGYLQLLQQRRRELLEQESVLLVQAEELREQLRQTMCSQSILREDSA